MLSGKDCIQFQKRCGKPCQPKKNNCETTVEKFSQLLFFYFEKNRSEIWADYQKGN